MLLFDVRLSGTVHIRDGLLYKELSLPTCGGHLLGLMLAFPL